MPNILLLIKLNAKNPSKEISTCVGKRIPTKLRKSAKLLYITCSALNMFVGK